MKFNQSIVPPIPMSRFLLALLLLLLIKPAAASSDFFTTPENLKDNVLFWKKIYSEYSLKQGVIHDREFPLIIYKVVDIGNRKGRSRSRFVRSQNKLVRDFLKNMAKKPPSRWNDIEKEVAELFELHASLKNIKTASSRVRLQQGQKERFKKGLERSGAYLAFIGETFKKYKIPQRIIYLPHVESSFNTNAYSRVGAAGMWQFMRGTGRQFMRIDYRVDERRDPFKSTVAAAKLLRKNFEQTKAWPLAITAYNHGLVSIKRAVRQTGSRDLGIIIEKYKNRRFKFASKNFYSCFLAASEIAANPNKYFKDIDFHLPQKYHTIKMDSYMRPRTIAKALDVPEATLKRLNPAIRSIVFRRQLSIPRGYRLRIPSSLSPDTVSQKLASIPASSKSVSLKGGGYYTVRRGDTLYGISRRFRVPTEELIVANEISRENRIYIGQVLRIPGLGNNKSKKTTPTKPKPEPKPEQKPEQKPETKPEPLPTPPTKTISTTPTSPIKQTQSKSNPKTILPTKKQPDEIDNQALEKPKGSAPDEDFDATLYNLDSSILTGDKTAQITATVNESLGHFAEWLNTSVRRIRNLNRGRRSIRVNQKIIIPLNNPKSLEEFNGRRLEYHMALEEDFYSQYQVIDTKTRNVKNGDTLWSICIRDEEIPIWLFKKYNRHIDIENLKINMKLTIPVLSSKNGSNDD
jgi:membrane-bound lytic murein transglycosylase D